MQTNQYITTSQMAEMLGVVRMTVSRAINSLKEKGIVKRVDGDKGGYWEILPKK